MLECTAITAVYAALLRAVDAKQHNPLRTQMVRQTQRAECAVASVNSIFILAKPLQRARLAVSVALLPRHARDARRSLHVVRKRHHVLATANAVIRTNQVDL